MAQCRRIVEDSLYGEYYCDRPVYLNGLCKEHTHRLEINLPQLLLSGYPRRKGRRPRKVGKIVIRK